MNTLTHNDVGSLAGDILARINAKHAELKAAVEYRPSEAALLSGLIAEIWRLADEFNAATLVEHTLARARGNVHRAHADEGHAHGAS